MTWSAQHKQVPVDEFPWHKSCIHQISSETFFSNGSHDFNYWSPIIHCAQGGGLFIGGSLSAVEHWQVFCTKGVFIAHLFCFAEFPRDIPQKFFVHLPSEKVFEPIWCLQEFSKGNISSDTFASKLYIPSTINVWRNLLRKVFWVDWNWLVSGRLACTPVNPRILSNAVM